MSDIHGKTGQLLSRGQGTAQQVAGGSFEDQKALRVRTMSQRPLIWLFTVLRVAVRDIVPEIIDSGPMPHSVLEQI